MLKFSRAIFCNFHLEPKLWRHKWRHFPFCKTCRRAIWFPPLDSSEDFMRRGGLCFLYLLYFPSYDVINNVIMSDADCTPGREPRSVAASVYQKLLKLLIYHRTIKKLNDGLCRDSMLGFCIEHVLVWFVKNQNMLIIICVLYQKVCVIG